MHLHRPFCDLGQKLQWTKQFDEESRALFCIIVAWDAKASTFQVPAKLAGPICVHQDHDNWKGAIDSTSGAPEVEALTWAITTHAPKDAGGGCIRFRSWHFWAGSCTTCIVTQSYGNVLKKLQLCNTCGPKVTLVIFGMLSQNQPSSLALGPDWLITLRSCHGSG